MLEKKKLNPTITPLPNKISVDKKQLEGKN
jgi:hypothetical protein